MSFHGWPGQPPNPNATMPYHPNNNNNAILFPEPNSMWPIWRRLALDLGVGEYEPNKYSILGLQNGIERLHLSFAPLDIRSIAHLQNIGQALQVLSLSGCTIKETGAATLAGCLWAMPNLERLDLSCNALGDEGVKSLVRAVPQKIQVFSVYCNMMTDIGLRAIAEVLPSWVHLRHFDARLNELTDGGVGFCRQQFRHLLQQSAQHQFTAGYARVCTVGPSCQCDWNVGLQENHTLNLEAIWNTQPAPAPQPAPQPAPNNGPPSFSKGVNNTAGGDAHRSGRYTDMDSNHANEGMPAFTIQRFLVPYTSPERHKTTLDAVRVMTEHVATKTPPMRRRLDLLLDLSRRLAGNHAAYGPRFHPLEYEDLLAIVLYTAEDNSEKPSVSVYEHLNGTLRDKNRNIQTLEPCAYYCLRLHNALDKAAKAGQFRSTDAPPVAGQMWRVNFAMLPRYNKSNETPRELFKGIKLNETNIHLFHNWQAIYAKGKQVNWYGFVSTSVDSTVASDFLGDAHSVMFQFVTYGPAEGTAGKALSNAVDITAASAFPDETEVVLAPPLHCSVIDSFLAGKVVVVKLQIEAPFFSYV